MRWPIVLITRARLDELTARLERAHDAKAEAEEDAGSRDFAVARIAEVASGHRERAENLAAKVERLERRRTRIARALAAERAEAALQRRRLAATHRQVDHAISGLLSQIDIEAAAARIRSKQP